MNHALLHGGHYAAVVGVCLAAVRPLAASRWAWRAPRTAILLWQVLALSLASSLVGLCLAVGLAPYQAGELRALVRWASPAGSAPADLAAAELMAVNTGLAVTAGVAAAIVWQLATMVRARRRHRSRLALVARPDPIDPRLLILDHPAALAYCLPGRARTVVVSAGAVDRLGPDQLAAVLDHERAHLRERHDLVLLPFAALRRVLPRSRLALRAYRAVALLIEMRADDVALRRHPPGRLAAALRTVSGTAPAPVPEGALGMVETGEDGVAARLRRLARPAGLHPAATTLALAVAAVTVATPASLYLFP